MSMQKRLLETTAANFVAEHYGARAGTVQLVGAGEWSQAFAFSLDGQEAVIRFGKYRADFAKGAVMGESPPPALPVPKVLELGETPAGFFAVSERRHGLFLDVLDGSQIRSALPSLLSTLHALRHADLTGTSGYGTWMPDRQGPHATDFDVRLVAYQLHIGLDHLAYTAPIGRGDDLDRNDRQARELLAVADA